MSHGRDRHEACSSTSRDCSGRWLWHLAYLLVAPLILLVGEDHEHTYSE